MFLKALGLLPPRIRLYFYRRLARYDPVVSIPELEVREGDSGGWVATGLSGETFAHLQVAKVSRSLEAHLRDVLYTAGPLPFTNAGADLLRRHVIEFFQDEPWHNQNIRIHIPAPEDLTPEQKRRRELPVEIDLIRPSWIELDLEIPT